MTFRDDLVELMARFKPACGLTHHAGCDCQLLARLRRDSSPTAPGLVAQLGARAVIEEAAYYLETYEDDEIASRLRSLLGAPVDLERLAEACHVEWCRSVAAVRDAAMGSDWSTGPAEILDPDLVRDLDRRMKARYDELPENIRQWYREAAQRQALVAGLL